MAKLPCKMRKRKIKLVHIERKISFINRFREHYIESNVSYVIYPITYKNDEYFVELFVDEADYLVRIYEYKKMTIFKGHREKLVFRTLNFGNRDYLGIDVSHFSKYKEMYKVKLWIPDFINQLFLWYEYKLKEDLEKNETIDKVDEMIDLWDGVVDVEKCYKEHKE